jgi:MFS transporter, FHS family, L-fucose permease
MQNSSVEINNQDSKSSVQTHRFALFSLTSLFFMWGFITCLNDILIPYLKAMFDLNYTQAMLIQFCFFGSYFIVSLPAGALVSKIGYKAGIVVGLAIASVGCLLFYPAAQVSVYALFLFALFILAAGITVLQVAANPYVSALGPSETASARLTMTQAFNALGTTVAPIFGAWLIFKGAETLDTSDPSSVQIPYIFLAAALIVLAAIFSYLKLPKLGKAENYQLSPSKALEYKHLRLGAIGIFVYVGAEVAIGSFLVNFLSTPEIGGLTETTAAHYITYYWGGAMVGRFLGALIMQKIPANKVLAFNSICAMILVTLAIVSQGKLAMWAILAVGLFNSIMFPTIFSLAINKLKDATSHGAGVLCLAIVGGAIIPLLQGMLADLIGLQMSFILPIVCYIFIVYYALVGFLPTPNEVKE